MYHPGCKYSKDMQPEMIKLANAVQSKGLEVNVLAVNDGFAPQIRKEVTNFKITYYPTILLYSGKDVIEFNPPDKDKYNNNAYGIQEFLGDNGIKSKSK